MSIKGLVESPKAARKTLDESKAESKPKKRVRFHGRVKRRFFDRVEDPDREQVWYTSADYAKARKFEDALRDYVSADKEHYRKNLDSLNAQGIITQEQAKKKYQLIDVSIDAVLDEQERQESDFYDANSVSGELFALNDEKIAEVYRCHAYEALEQAQSRASRHARHLQETQGEPGQSPELSPSRLVKRERVSPRSKKAINIRQLPAPSVFVTEEYSQRVRCTAA